jgi:hypothetical protein
MLRTGVVLIVVAVTPRLVAMVADLLDCTRLVFLLAEVYIVSPILLVAGIILVIVGIWRRRRHFA